MKIRFYNAKEGEPTEFELDHVPSIGDEITLDFGNLYRVKSRRWQLTSKGLEEVGVSLEEIVETQPN